MRELLFKGKQVVNHKWAESLCPLGTMASGVVINEFIPNTVCQYTGLNDKWDIKIFEHDIIRNDYDNFTAVIRCLNNTSEMVAEVINGGIMDLSSLQSHRIEIIGNIYDDPDLMEGSVYDYSKSDCGG